MEEEELLMELTPAERWIYLNAQLIADLVLNASEGKTVIPLNMYDAALEEELMQKLRYMPLMVNVTKTEGGIEVEVRQE